MTTDAMTSDPRPAFFAAADQAARLICEVTPADLRRPTPCAEFDVEALTGHVVAVFVGSPTSPRAGTTPGRRRW